MKRSLIAIILPLILLGCAETTLAQNAAVFPQIVIGGGYSTVVMITNDGWQRMSYQIELYLEDPTMPVNSNGKPLLPGQGTTLYSLPNGRGEAIALDPYETKKIVYTGGAQTTVGYLTIDTTTSYWINMYSSFAVFFECRDGAHLVSTTGGPAAKAGRTDLSYRVMFPVEKSATVRTGFAWAFVTDPAAAGTIPGGGIGTFTAKLYDSQKRLISARQVPADTHKAMFIDELFDANLMPDGFVGMVTINAMPDMMYTTVFRMEITTGNVALFTSVPPAVY